LFFELAEDAKSEKKKANLKISHLFSLTKKKREEPRHSSPVYLSSRSVCKTQLTSICGSQWDVIFSISMSVLILETGAKLIK
jgi:hypothetical protein